MQEQYAHKLDEKMVEIAVHFGIKTSKKQ